MNKHTQGPWWLDGAEDVDLPNHVGISSDAHGLLAQVVWVMEEDKILGRASPTCEANAYLIAAAPDLFDALETIAMGNTDPDRMIEIAKDAIQKIKGENK